MKIKKLVTLNRIQFVLMSMIFICFIYVFVNGISIRDTVVIGLSSYGLLMILGLSIVYKPWQWWNK
jgi:hypothetical protein